MKKLILLMACLIVNSIMGIEKSTIIQMTLSDSRDGLLNGNRNAHVSLIDKENNTTYWKKQTTIYFKNGFTELVVGPIESMTNIQSPVIVVDINNHRLEFPVYPTLFAIHSNEAHQLSDTHALYIHDGKAGFGTKTPPSKISVSGNIAILNPTGKLIFENGATLSGPLLNDITTKVNEFNHTSATDISHIETKLANLEQSISDISSQKSEWSFDQLEVNNTLTHALVIDSTGTPYQRPLIDPSESALVLNNTGFSINDSQLHANQLVTWQNNQLVSLQIPDNGGLVIQNNELKLNTTMVMESDQVGIGISPTQRLDVNGAMRLRSMTRPTLLASDAGTIAFSNNEFHGWNGTEWRVLSQTPQEYSPVESDVWVSNGNHIITHPTQFVGIKTDTPQATLDINGSLRVQSIPTGELNDVLMVNSDGHIIKKTLALSDIITTTTTSPIQLTDNTLTLGDMGASTNQWLGYTNDGWAPVSLTASPVFTINDHHISLAIPTVNNRILVFNNNEWQHQAFISNQFEFNNGLTLASQNATNGQVLTWNGTQWSPASPAASPTFTAGNGIEINNNTIQLSPHLKWEDSTFSIGENTNASLLVNQFSSSATYPLKITDGTTDVFKVDSNGKTILNYNGPANEYAFESNGFTRFDHVLTRYQSSIGTENIGTLKFGPTLLIQSRPTTTDQDNRSILEVLDPNGVSRLEVQDSGNVGINTPTPNATLDINGFARLKPYSSEPATCTIDRVGAMALTSQFTLCACSDATSTYQWVSTHDGTSACDW
jgi:hypothetical protein